jgi:hypothetical protein
MRPSRFMITPGETVWALSLAMDGPNKPGNDCTISLDVARTDVVIGVGANPPDLGPVHTLIPMAYQKVTPPAIA